MVDGLPPRLLPALRYAERGWPVLPIKPRSKEPLTRHAVKDATTDRKKIEGWFKKWPNANVGIACGSPGPDALDIDDLKAGAAAMKTAVAAGGPDVATARGRQFYFLGSTRGTVALGFGELRSTGSYVVAPPSWHPDGVQYTWVTEPSGLALPKLPDGIVPVTATTAGAGEMPERAGLIPYGERHTAIKDYCVRQVRSGVLDAELLEANLRTFFEQRCVPTPKPGRNYFRDHVKWALDSRIADRERSFAERASGEPAAPKGKAKRITGLESPPHRDAPLKDHRDYVSTAGGWGDRIDVESVVRFGQRGADALVIKLTNGQVVEFEKQDQVARSTWPRIVTLCTNGIAHPISVNEVEALNVLRSLCILADAPVIAAETDALEDALRTLVAACDVWDDHDLSTNLGRYDAIRRAHARGSWTPRCPEDRPPVVIVDRADGRLHLRAGEVFQWFANAGLKPSYLTLSGRMLMVGAERWQCRGNGPGGRAGDRRTMMLYRLSSEWIEP